MHNNKNVLKIASIISLATTSSASLAEGFLEDSKAKIQTKNFYLNRDFRDGSGQNKRDEWAQGFILDYQSGFTTGSVGFGVDALGMLGVKLDSSPDRTGTGLLPVHDDGRAPDEYSKLGLTGKVRLSESELKIGTLIPDLPSVQANTGRILPQTFQGGLLTSNEWDSLTFAAGRLNKVTDRDMTAAQDLALNNKNRRFTSANSDHFDLAGVEYTFTPSLSANYHYGQLDDIYRQHLFGLVNTVDLGDGKIKTDLRLAISRDQGAALGGKIDNRALNGMLSYSLKGHGLGVGYQRMSGGNAFPYIDGTDPYLVNFIQINDFAGAKEKSWQLRYDFNFAAVGVPGLTFMTRYVNGKDVELAGGNSGLEWERNTELQYVIQSGTLKNVGIRWRNATYRSDFTRGVDENRLIISYSLPLL